MGSFDHIPTGPQRAPRGTEKTCKSWAAEAAMRMLMNNLDPDNAERPEDLVVYGGTGKAARSWPDFHRIVASLQDLEDDETLIVQSGRAQGIFKTHEDAPRVLIANSLLVPEWANWDEFNRLEAMGLTMYGQMTAGSWIYIGTQGILQGTYETFAACAKQHFGGSLAGRLVVTGGLGGMGGAQPLAATMNGAAVLCIEVDPARIQRRLDTRYLMAKADTLDEAMQLLEEAKAANKPLSVGLLGNCAEVLPEMVSRGIIPDVITDQTSAHDELAGYVPDGMSLEEADALRVENPQEYVKRSVAAMGRHVFAMREMQKRGAIAFDYGNNIRAQAVKAGVDDAFEIKGFIPEYIRPLFCEGKGPFRWAALSGDPADRSKYQIGVLREDRGRGGSKLLHRIFTEGRKVFISRPINHFPLEEGAAKSFLMGGGIGVTPMIAMAHRLHALGREFELHYSVSQRQEAGFLTDLAAVPWAARVHLHISAEGSRAQLDQLLSGYRQGYHVYTCGPERYMESVIQAAERQGYPEEARHLEYFSVPELPEYKNHEFTLRLARSGRAFQIPAEKSATDVLQENGIAIDVKCSDGICGVCKCGLISGEVEHRDFVLSKAQRETSVILCQSRAAAKDGVIEVDL